MNNRIVWDNNGDGFFAEVEGLDAIEVEVTIRWEGSADVMHPVQVQVGYNWPEHKIGTFRVFDQAVWYLPSTAELTKDVVKIDAEVFQAYRPKIEQIIRKNYDRLEQINNEYLDYQSSRDEDDSYDWLEGYSRKYSQDTIDYAYNKINDLSSWIHDVTIRLQAALRTEISEAMRDKIEEVLVFLRRADKNINAAINKLI